MDDMSFTKNGGKRERERVEEGRKKWKRQSESGNCVSLKVVGELGQERGCVGLEQEAGAGHIDSGAESVVMGNLQEGELRTERGSGGEKQNQEGRFAKERKQHRALWTGMNKSKVNVMRHPKWRGRKRRQLP